jgi:hypothetical protein
VLATGLDLQPSNYRLRVASYDPVVTREDVVFAIADAPRFIDLPGDAAIVTLENFGPGVITTPALVFEIAI